MRLIYTCLVQVALLVAPTVALGQVDNRNLGAQQVVPRFQVTGYRPLGEGAQGGSLRLVHGVQRGETFADNAFDNARTQSPNVSVTGPDGFSERLEVGGEAVLEGLAPGVYAVAATDEDLQLLEGTVEVRPGRVVTVVLRPVGMSNQYRNENPQFLGLFDVHATATPEDTNTGSLAVAARPAGAVVNVVGPGGFSEHYEGVQGDLLLEDLVPGWYTVAATAEGHAVSRATVRVRVGQRTEVSVRLEPPAG